MKTIKEFEFIIWIIASILFLVCYVIIPKDTFLNLSMVAIIIARISALKNEINQ
jgi:hypothetical protein